ncbi:hypothetical protein AVEN_253268-1 [Araneus ventricosus]|uniref:Uncharacterized protein n=1 Tax=Araneus ventricosus TaxID=182803 RepID=A0A4Y2SJS6_ARAVE|nr:hypothetical protein AVEN_253268-1 [Araneus ventricosus]
MRRWLPFQSVPFPNTHHPLHLGVLSDRVKTIHKRGITGLCRISSPFPNTIHPPLHLDLVLFGSWNVETYAHKWYIAGVARLVFTAASQILSPPLTEGCCQIVMNRQSRQINMQWRELLEYFSLASNITIPTALRDWCGRECENR